MSRVGLGRSENIFKQVHADMLDGCIETVRLTTLEIHRTRVFFDEVRMITLHRGIPHDLLWTGVVLAAIGGLVGIALAFTAPVVAAIAGLVIGLPGAVMAVLALALRSIVLTVQGPRLHARVVAVLNQHRVEDAHREILRRVAAAQPARQPEPVPPSP